MIYSRHTHHFINKGSKLLFSDTMINIGLAITNTIWSLYIKSFGLTNSQVGLFSAFLVIISLFTSILAVPIIEKYKKERLLIMSIVIAIVAYTIIALTNNLYVFAFAASALTIVSIFRITSFGILFKNSIKPKNFEKKESLLYVFENAGWLVGPLIAGYFLLSMPMQMLFLIAALFYLFALLSYSSTTFIKIKESKKSFDKNYLKNINDFLLHKKLKYSYIASCGLATWWALVYTYIPLFAIDKGVTENEIAILLSIIILPLVATEYKVGLLAKKYSSSLFIRLGFLGLIIISILLFFTANIHYQFLLIIVASIFAAFLEPTLEIIFFKQTSTKEEEKFYSLYRTATSIGSLITKIIIAGVLLILPNNFSFIVVTLLLTIALLASFKIKK